MEWRRDRTENVWRKESYFRRMEICIIAIINFAQ